MIYSGIDKNSVKYANWLTGLHYPAQPKVKIKMIKENFHKMCTQSHMYGSIEVFQMVLTLMKEINELDDKSLHGQDKFDLILGEVEQLAVSLMDSFEKRYSKTYAYKPQHSIEDLKERVKNWTVTAEEY